MSEATSQQQQQWRRRHGAPVLSVEKFAHRKGVTKAIQSFRKRKEKKRVHTATALRQYKKVMKQEGYQPGAGASRKRVDDDEATTTAATALATTTTATAAATHESNSNIEQEQKPTESNETSADLNNKPARRKKTNPFQKSIQKAEERKQNMQQQQEDRDVRENERNEKLRQRKQRHQLLTARTRKGQPVMKNVVQDILSKLQNERKNSKT
jgi:hypothetical protein